MLRLQRAASVERSSSSSSSSTNRPRLGVWWSLAPRRLYKCSLCSLRFDSLKALGGHQNAHRHQRNEMQKLMNVNLLSTPPNHHHPMVAQPPPNGQEIDLELGLRCGPPNQKIFYEFLPLKEQGHGLYGYGVSGAPFGIKPTYHHIPKYHPYITPAPAAYNGQRQSSSLLRCQRPQLPLMTSAGANACGSHFLEASLSGQNGGWGGAGGFLEASASSGANAALFYLGVDNSTGSASMNELDLTLKL